MKKLTSNPYKTALTIVTGFLIIYLLIEFRGAKTNVHWALIVASSIGLASVLSKFLSVKIEYLWFKLTWLLSLVMPNIILSLVFYLILFPISMISRLMTKQDTLMKHNRSLSTFKTVNKEFEKDSFEKMW